jgi:hypothetical protein
MKESDANADAKYGSDRRDYFSSELVHRASPRPEGAGSHADCALRLWRSLTSETSPSIDLFGITASERGPTAATCIPESKNNKAAAGHAVVDVVPGASEIEPTNVRVVPRRAARSNSRLLRKHIKRRTRSNPIASRAAGRFSAHQSAAR